MEALFSLQLYTSGTNSPLIIGMGNHKIPLKDFSLKLIIKYHITTIVKIILNKCYIHCGFVQNVAH